MTRRRDIVSMAVLCCILFGSAGVNAEIRFTEVAEQAGVAVVHEPRGFVDRAGLDFQNHSGPGASFADINLDGWPDLLIADGFPRGEEETRGNHFYLNNGDGTFSEVSFGKGVRTGRVANAVLIADANNDGYSDLLFSNHFADPSFLRGTRLGFANMSNTSGLPYLFYSPSMKPDDYTGPRSAGMAAADYDKDGLLDIYLVNQSTFPDILVRNLDGTYFQPTDAIDAPSQGTGFQPVWFDYDDDGDQDVFVVRDVSVDYLYRNEGRSSGWIFTEVAARLKIAGGASYAENKSMGMGCAIADFDNDLDEDVYVTNFRLNTLYENPGTWAEQPLSRFKEVGALKNVDHDWNGWGCAFFDADNDGDLDLYLVNGWVEGALEARQRDTYLNPNVFYENNGPNANADKNYDFSDVTATAGAGVNDPAVGRGLAVADYDRDGDLDMFVTNNTYYENALNPHLGDPIFWGQHRLFRNDDESGNHWLHLRLQGADTHAGRYQCTRDAVGAKAYLTAGGLTQMRVVRVGSGYQGMHSIELEFGLGTTTEIDELRVVWPCGAETSYTNLLPDRQYRIVENQDALVAELSFQELNVQATTQGMLIQWLCDPSLAGSATWIYRLEPEDSRARLLEEITVSYEGNRGLAYDPDVVEGEEYAYRVVIEGMYGDEHRSLYTKASFLPTRQFALGQNYPNPFNPKTFLQFSLPREMKVRMEILDVRGRRVRLLFDRRWDAGDHETIWNGLDDRDGPVASGVYFYRLSSEGGAITRKLTMLR